MKKGPPEIDAYIGRSAEFARPILEKIRALFHEGCPGVEEKIRWGTPHFDHKGIMGSMAAFKKHVSFGFWKGQLMGDPEGLFERAGDSHLGVLKVEQATDLPTDEILLSYIREAVELNDRGVKVPRLTTRRSVAEVEIPEDFRTALSGSAAARGTFEAFSYSHRKEYVEWVLEAKRPATRERRIATALEWLAEGKPRNWRYS
jgi:uncharacterized protein YdeI (YjbR/CyaY-like superfamily)